MQNPLNLFPELTQKYRWSTYYVALRGLGYNVENSKYISQRATIFNLVYVDFLMNLTKYKNIIIAGVNYYLTYTVALYFINYFGTSYVHWSADFVFTVL